VPHTDQIAGPVIISAFLFFAVLANFIFRGALLSTHLDGLFRLTCPRFFWCDGIQFANCMSLPLFLCAIPGLDLILPFAGGRGMLPFLVSLS
jgi:hypothetical protein